MERLILTEDGSHSLFSKQHNQQYHSLQGALNESMHIYIHLGLLPVLQNATKPVYVFEMGLGTGLNALLAWQLADQLQKKVCYISIEAFPVCPEEASLLNYGMLTSMPGFLKLHETSWSTDHQLSEFFSFRKEKIQLEKFTTDQVFDVIFYDAFDPKSQPELWTEEIFSKIAAQTCTNGVLVTYSSKGIVKRALRAVGFEVKRYPGPGNKTHVLRAIKN